MSVETIAALVGILAAATGACFWFYGNGLPALRAQWVLRSRLLEHEAIQDEKAALGIALRLADHPSAVQSLLNIGAWTAVEGWWRDALNVYTAAEALCRLHRIQNQLGPALRGRGESESRLSKHAAAKGHLHAALEAFGNLPNNPGRWVTLIALSELAVARKDWSEATRRAKQAEADREIFRFPRFEAAQARLDGVRDAILNARRAYVAAGGGPT